MFKGILRAKRRRLQLQSMRPVPTALLLSKNEQIEQVWIIIRRGNRTQPMGRTPSSPCIHHWTTLLAEIFHEQIIVDARCIQCPSSVGKYQHDSFCALLRRHPISSRNPPNCQVPPPKIPSLPPSYSMFSSLPSSSKQKVLVRQFALGATVETASHAVRVCATLARTTQFRPTNRSDQMPPQAEGV